jgi:AcrR family transcriptional regulator
MPRLPGQIDQVKRDAVLDAASQVIAERGLGAPLDAIARRAGVSKQTLYNQFGDRAGLVRAMISRRVDALAAPLTRGGTSSEAVLAEYAREMMNVLLAPGNLAATRLAIQGAIDMPDIARTIHQVGAQASRARLADYLRTETAAGRLDVDDPNEAAELFAGMVGALQVRTLMGVTPAPDAATMERLSGVIAKRFVRAYAA